MAGLKLSDDPLDRALDIGALVVMALFVFTVVFGFVLLWFNDWRAMTTICGSVIFVLALFRVGDILGRDEGEIDDEDRHL